MGKMSDVAIAMEKGCWKPFKDLHGFYINPEGQIVTFMQIATGTLPKLSTTNPFENMLP